MMNTFRKWWLLLAIALVPLSAHADGLLSNKFLASGAGTSINNIGTAIAFHKLTWNVSGTASVCTVALDTSADGIIWSAGGAIVGQTCTSNGASTVANVIANYVRINMTALTVTAGSSVTVTWTGGINAAGGAGFTGTLAATQIAFGSAANTIAGDPNLLWDTSNTRLTMGVPKAGFNALAQIFLDNSVDGYFSFRTLEGTTRTSTIHALAQFDPSTASTLRPLDTTAILSNAATYTNHSEREAAGFTILADGGDLLGGFIVSAIGASAQVSSNANVSSIRVIDMDSNNNGNGNIDTLYGAFSSMGNHGTGTISESSDFYAAGDANDGGGVITSSYGFHGAKQTGGINSYSFAADDQGSGANSYAFFSAGGKNKFARGATSTSSVVDILDGGATDGPFGLLSVRGTGVAGTASQPVLAEFRTINDNSYALTVSNTAAPGGSYMYFWPVSPGNVDIVSSDGTATVGIFLDGAANGAHVANSIGFLASAGLDVGGTVKAPSFTNKTSGHLLISGTAPTVSSGFGTGASVTASNGTTAFRVSVGTSNTGTGIISLPTATTGWNCYATDITTTSTTVSQTKQITTGSDSSHAALQNYTDISGTGAWTDSDVLAVSCFAY